MHRLDRLSVGYTSGSATLRFGRQAVSWGNGLAFQVLDFVNPFSPLAIDKDYKTGEDMLYGQWQWTGLGDAQLMLLPRRDPLTRDLDHEQASQALKLHTRGAGFDVDVLVARHYDQTLLRFGCGAQYRWRGVAFRCAADRGIGARRSVVAGRPTLITPGYCSARTCTASRSITAMVSAVPVHPAILLPTRRLTARLARGEVYTVGRDYAALGVQVELSPLVNAFATIIQNLNDASRYITIARRVRLAPGHPVHGRNQPAGW